MHQESSQGSIHPCIFGAEKNLKTHYGYTFGEWPSGVVFWGNSHLGMKHEENYISPNLQFPSKKSSLSGRKSAHPTLTTPSPQYPIIYTVLYIPGQISSINSYHLHDHGPHDPIGTMVFAQRPWGSLSGSPPAGVEPSESAIDLESLLNEKLFNLILFIYCKKYIYIYKYILT